MGQLNASNTGWAGFVAKGPRCFLGFSCVQFVEAETKELPWEIGFSSCAAL